MVETDSGQGGSEWEFLPGVLPRRRLVGNFSWNEPIYVAWQSRRGLWSFLGQLRSAAFRNYPFVIICEDFGKQQPVSHPRRIKSVCLLLYPLAINLLRGFSTPGFHLRSSKERQWGQGKAQRGGRCGDVVDRHSPSARLWWASSCAWHPHKVLALQECRSFSRDVHRKKQRAQLAGLESSGERCGPTGGLGLSWEGWVAVAGSL